MFEANTIGVPSPTRNHAMLTSSLALAYSMEADPRMAGLYSPPPYHLPDVN
jgi:hypothetical protein